MTLSAALFALAVLFPNLAYTVQGHPLSTREI